jgi:hypothetical protein
VPPFLNLAVTDGGRRSRRSRIWIRVGIRSRRAIVVRVSDADNSVIELFSAVSISLNNTGLVELECVSAGIEGDGHWLLHPYRFHLSDSVGRRVHVDALRPGCNDFAIVVPASTFYGVGIR